jgi:hypothetical protein
MSHDNHNPAAKTFAQLLGIAVVIVIANVVALPHIDVHDLPDLPDIPGWVGFVVAKFKLIVVAIVILLAIAGEQAARRRRGDGAGDGA